MLRYVVVLEYCFFVILNTINRIFSCFVQGPHGTVYFSCNTVIRSYLFLHVLSPISTTRVDGPSWRVTGFHYPSSRAALTGARFH